jgi:hypothetical protein
MDSKIKEELEIKKEGISKTSSQLPFKVEAKVDISPMMMTSRSSR